MDKALFNKVHDFARNYQNVLYRQVWYFGADQFLEHDGHLWGVFAKFLEDIEEGNHIDFDQTSGLLWENLYERSKDNE